MGCGVILCLLQARSKSGKGRVFSRHHGRDSLVARCILNNPVSKEEYTDIGNGFSFHSSGTPTLSAEDVQRIVSDDGSVRLMTRLPVSPDDSEDAPHYRARAADDDMRALPQQVRLALWTTVTDFGSRCVLHMKLLP